MNDKASLQTCSSDADCPSGEFCDSSYGNGKNVCDSGKSCTSTYVVTKRSLFGLMGAELRVGRVKIGAREDIRNATNRAELLAQKGIFI